MLNERTLKQELLGKKTDFFKSHAGPHRPEYFRTEDAKIHYQKRRCLEAQVEFTAEAIDEGEAQMDAPLHANDGTPFPRALTTMQGKVLDWEIAATVDMVIRSLG